MKITLNAEDCASRLVEDKNANWSWNGALALANHLEEVEFESGEEIEFDAVGIRCEFSEFAGLREWISEYYGVGFDEAMKSAGIDLDGTETDEDIDRLIAEHIADHGTLIEFTGGIIVSSF
jgi:hypothetical protein